MKPSTVLGLTLASPFIIVGGTLAVIGVSLLISVDTVRRLTCSHNWKYVGFWRDRAEGEYERICKNCDVQEFTNEVKEDELMYKIANIERQ